jgi:D-hexose-6-phosphate mutarotase
MTNLIKINKDDWQLEVDLNGGRIVDLEKDGQKILGTFERIDGKSGNTHICVPNFAAEGVEKYGFIFHGPFRNSEWKLISKTDESLEISGEIEGLKVTQKFKIGEKWEQEIVVKNVSNESKRVNVAMHNYWNTDFSWEGTKLNGVDITSGIKDSIDLEIKENNILEIPKKMPINWQLVGFKYVKLWTGFKEENGQKTFDQKYICVEPVMEKEGFVETEESWLGSEKEIVLGQKIGF